MKYKNTIPKILVFIYIVLAALIYSTNIISEENRLFWENTLYLVAPAVSVIAGIYVLRKFGIGSIHGKAILFITIGLGMWLSGEILWYIFESIIHTKVFPSVADIFYLAAYPFFLFGIFNEMKIGKIIWTKKRLIISLAIMAILSVVTFYHEIYCAYDPEAAFAENVIQITYGVANLVVIICLILLVNLSILFSGGAFSRSWIIFTIGMFLYWVADLLAYAIYWEQYEALNWFFRQIDYFWIISFLMMSYALLKQRMVIDGIKIVPKR